MLALAGLTLLPVLAVADDRAAVTFAGFQTFDDQTSRIFLHVTKEPSLDVEKAKKSVVFILRDTRILVGNNKNPLNFEHFATPAKRARMLAVGDDVHFVIELKREVEVRHRFHANVDGSTSLQVDFPAP